MPSSKIYHVLSPLPVALLSPSLSSIDVFRPLSDKKHIQKLDLLGLGYLQIFLLCSVDVQTDFESMDDGRTRRTTLFFVVDKMRESFDLVPFGRHHASARKREASLKRQFLWTDHSFR